MSPFRTAEIDTDDVDDVHGLLRDAGAPSWFQVERSEHDFSFGASTATDGELTLAQYDVGGSWTQRAEPDLFLVATASSDAIRWTKGDERGVFTGAPVHFPPGRNDVRVDGSVELFEIQFSPAGLQRLAAEVHGVEHVRLGDGLRTPRTPRHAQYWQSVVRYTHGLLEGGLLRNDHLRAALKANLAATLLDAFVLVEGTRRWRLPSAAAQAAYRKAVAFIEAEAMLPISALDVARAVELPFPLLDEHFRTQAGATLPEYLRTFRVHAAHVELVRAEPLRTTAQEVVRRWGFTSLATFLPLHRAVYPGRTLPFELTDAS